MEATRRANASLRQLEHANSFVRLCFPRRRGNKRKTVAPPHAMGMMIIRVVMVGEKKNHLRGQKGGTGGLFRVLTSIFASRRDR